MTRLAGFRATTTRAFFGRPLREAAAAGAHARAPAPDDRNEGSADGDDGPSAPTALLPSVGDLVGGQYRLVRVLGEGNFGRVFVAERVDVPEHQVALKIVASAFYSGRNVTRELVMLAAASHPNIVQLKDHGITGDYVWFTMPVYEGETLASRLERGPLPLREAHAIFVPVARALEALHRTGLRHQDVKPENVFLATFAGQVHPILLDLGVAAEREGTFVAGTVLYASPEQIFRLGSDREGPRLSEKMDTYCLAATLLLALVGPACFPGEGAETLDQIARAHDARAHAPLHPAALPDVTGPARAAIGSAFCRWLAPDPDERPSMGEMAEQLDVLLEPERQAARDEERRRVRRRTVRRALAATFAALCAAGGIAAFGMRETLRLASELAQARAEGAASFDQLDTCIASFRVADHEAARCKEERTRERAAFEATVDRLAKSGSEHEVERARAVQALQAAFAGRLRACEDAASAAEQRFRQERERRAADHARREAELTAARDAERREAEACRSELASSRDLLARERHLCDVRATELASSRENLDRCRADLATCEDHRRREPAVHERPPIAARMPPSRGESPAAAATQSPAPLPPLPAPPGRDDPPN